MCKTKVGSIAIISAIALASAFAQQTDPNNKPNVFLDNTPKPGKPPKPSEARLILGVVKDQADNPVRGAIVQLKDMKTSKVIDFATKDDGKFAFRELSMLISYELTAKRDGMSQVKKVTPYDTRREVILNFHLEPPEQTKEQQ
jgi:hypothetical protein